jgi:C1A family cysteine protease
MKKLIAICVCLFLCLSLANAQSRELVELQKILAATGATWTAAENPVSRMSEMEQEHLLGLLPSIYDIAALPEETIDNTPVSRGEYTHPHSAIRDQRSCGSCYSFGACGIYEGWKMKAGQNVDLSEQWFMMKAKAIGPYGGCQGWYLDTSMNLLQNHGTADESACPYKGYEAACPSSAQPVHKIGSWARTTSLSTIKQALHNNSPVYVGFAVYSDFMSYSSGVYTFTSGSLRGYHAVAIVGYKETSSTDGHFLVKNSWNTSWGESGYFRIAYSQMSNQVQFGTCFGGSYYIVR